MRHYLDTCVDGGALPVLGKVVLHGVKVFRRVRVFLQVPIWVKVLLQLQQAPDVDGDGGGRQHQHKHLDGRPQQQRAVKAFEKEFEELALGAGRRLPVVLLRAEATSDVLLRFPPFVQNGQGDEKRHFQDEQHQNARHCVDAEGTKGRHALKAVENFPV